MSSVFLKEYAVLVIGAGHAGCEAALASARMGVPTLLMTQNLDTIGQMSCNPSIGGLGKGQLVMEIDAMGGEMARNTDRTGLQFRLLNTGKGSAVWSPRAQCDKKLYQLTMKWVVEDTQYLDLVQDEAKEILVNNGRIYAILTKRGITYRAKKFILTTGTFLNGMTHYGLSAFPAGRAGCQSSTFSNALADIGFKLDRYKTGTPMRINSRSIDFSHLDEQPGDIEPTCFSYRSMFNVKHQKKDHERTDRLFFDENGWSKYPQSTSFQQLPCWLTWTNDNTHEVIRGNLDKSPLYSGKIKSIGPRYCPSIEDKVVKFPDKHKHQVFLEPEGYMTKEYYVNGLFTSLPEDVQYKIVKTIPGLENSEIVRPGYAVEYDLCQPTQLMHTLQTKMHDNLYFAGQINGTTGYEEAAGQGFVAGVNAALSYLEREPFILGRDEAYLGVLIDDLVTKGTDEPYRMFTSRAEYRIHLRWNSTDIRLLPYGHRFGLIPDNIFKLFEAYRDCIASERVPDGDIGPWSRGKIEQSIEINTKYKGYINRETRDIERMRKAEHVKIPSDFKYPSVPGLLTESRQKFEKVRPVTLGQAKRIPGVTPTDVQILWVFIEKSRMSRN